MYGLRSTCLFQFSHKMRQTKLLYAYFTPKVDFKRKFNHHQSFLYEWRLTARTIEKISNRTINTNRISNRPYDSKSNRITKLRRSLLFSCSFVCSITQKVVDGLRWNFQDRFWLNWLSFGPQLLPKRVKFSVDNLTRGRVAVEPPNVWVWEAHILCFLLWCCHSAILLLHRLSRKVWVCQHVGHGNVLGCYFRIFSSKNRQSNVH